MRSTPVFYLCPWGEPTSPLRERTSNLPCLSIDSVFVSHPVLQLNSTFLHFPPHHLSHTKSVLAVVPSLIGDLFGLKSGLAVRDRFLLCSCRSGMLFFCLRIGRRPWLYSLQATQPKPAALYIFSVSSTITGVVVEVVMEWWGLVLFKTWPKSTLVASLWLWKFLQHQSFISIL